MAHPKDLVRVKVNKACLINEGGVLYRGYQEFVTNRQRARSLAVTVVETVQPYKGPEETLAAPPVVVVRKKRGGHNRMQAGGLNRAG